jgi:hypothetical protein
MKNDFEKKWKNIPHKLFISFCGKNEVMVDNPNNVFNKILKIFPKHSIKYKVYSEASHSYAGYENILIKDFINFWKGIE